MRVKVRKTAELFTNCVVLSTTTQVLSIYGHLSVFIENGRRFNRDRYERHRSMLLIVVVVSAF